MTTRLPPICIDCKRFHSNEIGFKCDAYPDGIPQAIVYNQLDHREPFDGDHGLQFLPENDAAAEHADKLIRLMRYGPETAWGDPNSQKAIEERKEFEATWQRMADDRDRRRKNGEDPGAVPKREHIPGGPILDL